MAALKPRPKLYVFPDPQLPGHYVRVMPSGSKSYVAIARDPRGTQVWKTIGKTADLTIEKAREEAISLARGRGGCNLNSFCLGTAWEFSSHKSGFFCFLPRSCDRPSKQANSSTRGSENILNSGRYRRNGDFRSCHEQTSIVFPCPVLEITERVFT